MAQGARAWVGELPAAARHHARPQAQHRVRGCALPQHRRVLAPRHGDLHDPRRHLHARLHLLRGGARPAGNARHRRAAPRRRSRREDGAEVRGHHLGGPRRFAGRRRRYFRGDHPRHQAPAARVPRRSADSRLQGRARAARDRPGGEAGCPQSQHRNRAAAVSRRPLRRPVFPHPRAARSQSHPRTCDPHQDRHDDGARRRAGRSHRGLQGSPEGRRVDPDARPVSAALGESRRDDALLSPG